MASRPAPAGRDIEEWGGADWPFALLAGAVAIVLVLAAYVVGEHLPPSLRCSGGTGCSRVQADGLSPFFVWDASWYESIAARGYSWRGISAGYQNPAFWPLWPLVLSALHAASPLIGVYHVLVVCVTVAVAVASGVVFHLLAGACACRGVARRATILYLVFPGMHYLLRSYPTGLLNIGVCLVLLALIRKRLWVAGLLSGLTIAAGPLALSAALTAGVVAIVNQRQSLFGRNVAAMRRAASAAKLACLAGLSLAGLFGFMAYLSMRFGDPLLFVSAESAWGRHPGLLIGAGRWLQWEAILPDIRLALRHASEIYDAPTANGSC